MSFTSRFVFCSATNQITVSQDDSGLWAQSRGFRPIILWKFENLVSLPLDPRCRAHTATGDHALSCLRVPVKVYSRIEVENQSYAILQIESCISVYGIISGSFHNAKRFHANTSVLDAEMITGLGPHLSPKVKRVPEFPVSNCPCMLSHSQWL